MHVITNLFKALHEFARHSTVLLVWIHKAHSSRLSVVEHFIGLDLRLLIVTSSSATTTAASRVQIVMIGIHGQKQEFTDTCALDDG